MTPSIWYILSTDTVRTGGISLVAKRRNRHSEHPAAQQERAGLYIRVSLDRTKHGMAEEIVSPDTQQDRGRDYCRAQAWAVAAVESDIDESGYRQHYTRREGLMRLLAAVDRGELTKIVVFKWSRISRRLGEFLEICNRVEAAGAGIVSITEQVDTSTPAGRLIRNIMASFAQFQSEEISEQIWHTWLTKAKSGKRPPGRAPYGAVYQRGALLPDPETHPHLLAMYRVYAETRSIAAVHDWLTEHRVTPAAGADRWSLVTIRRVLTNPAYVGLIEFSGEQYDGHYEPLVPVELWQQVQAIIAGRSTTAPDRIDAHLLRGRVICATCGRPMWTQYSKRWVDRQRTSDRYYWCADPHTLRDGCAMPAVHAGELEAAVWDMVLQLCQSGAVVRAGQLRAQDAGTSAEREREQLLTQQARTEGLVKQLFELLHDGEIDRAQFAAMNREYADQLAEIDHGLSALPPEVAPAVPTPDLLRQVARSAPVATTIPERRAVLDALEVQIEVTWRAVYLDVLGVRIRMPATLMGERWYFGSEYRRLDYQGTMLTDRQIRFVRRTYYRGYDKQAIARRLGRSYNALKRIAARLKQRDREEAVSS